MDGKEAFSDERYQRAYSESTLFEKIGKFAKSAGIKVIYAALLLYYVLQKPEVPTKAKATIIGALGYFILPFDAVPDAIPVLGQVDDLAALMLALVTVAVHIDAEVKLQARGKLSDWFGAYEDAELIQIDSKIGDGESANS